jgi:outer membrane protein
VFPLASFPVSAHHLRRTIPKKDEQVSQEAQALSCEKARAVAQEFCHRKLKEFFIQMKRTLAFVLTLASGFALGAAAQTSPAPAPSAPAASAPATAPAGPAKVAVIAFQAAVGQTNEFQRDFADLQKKYEPKRTQLKTLADEIDGLEKQLQAQGDKLSDTARASQTKTIDDKKKQAQRFAEDAQNDLTGEMNELYNKVASKVFDVLNAYATQQGFTLVLDGTANQQQSPVVLFASPSIDISKAIIDAYNVKSGVPAPPAQPAAPPSAPKPAAKPPVTH